jgi:putative endonuclease
LACAFLERRGLRLIEKNYRCKRGEIDLIMQHDRQLVFVEVRYRQSLAYGGPLASIDHKKRAKLIACALQYLQSTNAQTQARFDVVGISAENRIDWVQNAFDSD